MTRKSRARRPSTARRTQPTVVIVGVGLIGGSFALALRRSGFTGRILGVSSEPTLAAALSRGAIDEGLPLERAVPQADLIYLAQSIGRILDILPQVARLAPPSALVTDAGSTKVAVVKRAMDVFPPGKIFLGGHPMTGKAERGVEAAEGDLFRNATYVLTPSEGRLPSSKRVQWFCGWLKKLGARLMVMSPEIHDQIVAFTSHLPQLASTALASLLLEHSSNSWRVSGGGLRDTTRLARSAYQLWRDICLTNTENIDRALAAYIGKLDHLRRILRQRDLQGEFERGAEFAARLEKIFQDSS